MFFGMQTSSRRLLFLGVKIHEAEGQLYKQGVFTGLAGVKGLLEESKVQLGGVCSLPEVRGAAWQEHQLSTRTLLAATVLFCRAFPPPLRLFSPLVTSLALNKGI